MELCHRRDFLDLEDQASMHPRRYLYYRRRLSYDDEINEASRCLDRDPANWRALQQRANALMHVDDFEGALQDLTAVIDRHIAEISDAELAASVYFSRGVCFERLSCLDEAIGDFSAALDRSPSHKKAAYERAACQNKKGNFTAAIMDYERALKVDRARSNVLRNRPAKSKFARSRMAALYGGSGSKSSSPIAVRQGAASSMSELPHSAADPMSAYSSLPPLPTPSSLAGQHMAPISPGGLGPAGASLRSPPSMDHSYMLSTPVGSPGPRIRDGAAALSDVGGAHPFGRSRMAASLSDSFDDGDALAHSRSGVSQGPLMGSSASGRDVADGYHQRGFAFRKKGDLERAIAEYTHAIDADPTHFKALFNRGFCHDKRGDYDAAIRDYTAALELEPENAYTYYNLGISYDRKGEDYEKAVAMFSRAIDLDGTNPDFYHNRGFSRRKMGRFKEAIADYTKAIELHPRHFKAYYNRAFCYDKLAMYQKAVEDYSMAISIDPTNPNTHHNRGVALEKLGLVADAIKDFTAAIEISDSNAYTFNARGLAYDRQEKYDAALQDFTRAIALQRTNATFFHNRGITYRNKRDLNMAIEDYTSAIALNCDNVAVYNNRGFALRKLGQHELAVQDYTKALELQPSNLKTYNNRGYCHARLGNYKAAVSDYSKAISLDPHNIHALHNRGISYDKQNNYRAAIADFSKVIELDPENANAYFNRGTAFESIGDIRMALKDYQIALEIDTGRLGPQSPTSGSSSDYDAAQALASHPAAAAIERLTEGEAPQRMRMAPTARRAVEEESEDDV